MERCRPQVLHWLMACLAPGPAPGQGPEAWGWWQRGPENWLPGKASPGAPGSASGQTGGSQTSDYRAPGTGSAGADAAGPSPAPEPPEPVGGRRKEKRSHVDKLFHKRKRFVDIWKSLMQIKFESHILFSRSNRCI